MSPLEESNSARGAAFEVHVLEVMRREYPSVRWVHQGRRKHAERGMDLLGYDARQSLVIGVQVKLHSPHRTPTRDEWTKFLAGITVWRTSTNVFVTTGRLTRDQEEDASRLGIRVLTGVDIERLASRHGTPPSAARHRTPPSESRPITPSEYGGKRTKPAPMSPRDQLYIVGVTYPIWLVVLLLMLPTMLPEPILQAVKYVLSAIFPDAVGPFALILIYWLPWFYIVWSYFNRPSRSGKSDKPSQ